MATLLWVIFLGVVLSRLLDSCSSQPGQLNTHSNAKNAPEVASPEASSFAIELKPKTNWKTESKVNTQHAVLALNAQTEIERANRLDGAYYGVVHRYTDLVSNSRGDPLTRSELDRAKNDDNQVFQTAEHGQVATGYYFGTIRRVNVDDLPLPEKLEPGYLDTLIKEPPKSRIDKRKRLARHEGNTHHTVFSGALYRKDSDGETLDTGVEYRSTTQTNNMGTIRVSMVALNEDDDQGQTAIAGSGSAPQKGLRRVSVEQLNMPLAENIAMDNIAGMHRSTRYQFSGSRRATINQRFNLTSPDILGITSRIRSDNHAFSLSLGEMGELGGSFLTGFHGLDRDLYRAQYDYAAPSIGLSTEIWRTNGSDNSEDNRQGSRINIAKGFNSNKFEVQTTLAQSDDNFAALVDMFANSDSGSRQELGIYYFDPEFTWINTSIGNDSLGAFYRLQGRWLGSDISFNTEHRRNGLASESANKNSTHFSALSVNQRINRRLRLSGYYSYRRNNDHGDNLVDNTGDDHNLRALAVVQHNDDIHSTYSGSYRIEDNSQGRNNHLQLNFDWRKRFSNNNDININVESSRTTRTNDTSQQEKEYDASLGIDWGAHFLNNSSLSAGISVDWEKSEGSSESSHIGAHLNYDWAITPNLSFNAQLDHNQTTIESEDSDLSDSLLTAAPIEVNKQTSRTSSLLATLRYSFGGNDSPALLGKNNGKQGSGLLSGRLFVDENNDGQLQEFEAGLQGITVYLDSVYATITDSEGRFKFSNVTTGEHHIYIDQGALPLPWTLQGKEFYGLNIKLRRNTEVDIPVTRL